MLRIHLRYNRRLPLSDFRSLRQVAMAGYLL